MVEARKDFAIVGVGNCGGQIAFLAEKKYPNLWDSIYINTSDADLSMVNTENEELKFKVGEEEEVEGSGKNRARMKEYLHRDIKKILLDENLQDHIVDKKYVFIVVSAAGGTGSGAGPVLLEVMKQMFPDQQFILIGVLPRLGASLMEQGNTLEFLDEVYNKLGDSLTYMMYDNETTADMPVTVGLSAVNENIVEDLKVLTGVDNYATPYESIDPADMEAILSTPGRIIVARLTKNITEKVMEDTALDEMFIKAIKHSCHAETDRNKRVIRWGIITYFTEEVNKLYSPELTKLQEFIGEPPERFNHNAINDKSEEVNFAYLIASGLSPINDRVDKVSKQAKKLQDALAKDDTSKYILGNGVSYDVMAERKKQERRANQVETVKTDDIFAKYMK